MPPVPRKPTPKVVNPKLSSKPSSFAAMAKAQGAVRPGTKRAEPLWEGPCSNTPRGGITYSMLSRFIQCRERFRINSIEGLKPTPVFKAPIEYGQMWHICEEALADNKDHLKPLMAYCKEISAKYLMSKNEINHWFEYCKAQFPIYRDYWKAHPDVKNRTPMFQEEIFNVPYQIPGTDFIVYLRGKWDSVDIITRDRKKGVYIQENKSKSQIDDAKITRQLTGDLQTMIYMVALKARLKSDPAYAKNPIPVCGVRYNVIRRSNHKSVESLLEKIDADTKAGRLGEWFARWLVEISDEDVEVFCERTLNPLLNQVVLWYDHVIECRNNPKLALHGILHWQHPFGVRNLIDEGGQSDLDEYLLTGSEVGLRRTDEIFVELQSG